MATTQDLVGSSVYGVTIQHGLKMASYALAMGDAGYTLLHTHPPVILADPESASEILTLPAEALSKNLVFYIVDTGTGVEAVVVNDDGGSTIVTLAPGEMAMVHCDGTTWRGSVGKLT